MAATGTVPGSSDRLVEADDGGTFVGVGANVQQLRAPSSAQCW
jgi:hypothetical protein